MFQRNNIDEVNVDQVNFPLEVYAKTYFPILFMIR